MAAVPTAYCGEVEFLQDVKELLKISCILRDGWTLQCIKSTGDQYLSKKSVVRINVTPQTEDLINQFEDAELDGLSSSQVDTEDASCAVMDVGSEIYTFDYHVVYSPSYEVPVLYFNAYKTDGSLVGLKQLWASVPAEYQTRLQQDRWTFVTQQEHPLLRRPFYQLHPCRTADLMDTFKNQSGEGRHNKLISWLSVVGPVVHLKMGLEYGKHLQTPRDEADSET